jgi:ribosomal protein L30E
MAKTNLEELKKLAGEGRIVFGSTDLIRKLKAGSLEKVYLASNIPSDVENDIRHNATIVGVEIEKTDMPNDEFSIIFKRSHVLLSIGVLKV